ncbi:DUF4139 domain-containing protein [Alphaproteobacteria bacterium KMM 3653]|uniref:DUF4139 domain-containing protein n=1 Tax=Harenicola maris TaxID=2841044 RepID=A0AAP2CN78_9RHOB|nr:DUF4139 domain-containing protein [Harenicola maris]
MFFRSSLSLLALCAAMPALADDFRTTAPISSVVVYPQGASVSRSVSVELPAGAHRVLFPVSGQNLVNGPPRIKGEGDFAIGEVEILSGFVTDPEAVFTPAQTAAKAAAEEAGDAVTAKFDQLSTARIDLGAALAQIEFLRTVSAGSLDALNAEELAATAALIGGQIAEAEAKRQLAEVQVRALQEELADLQKIQRQAESDFTRLSPPAGPVDMLAVSVELASAGTVSLSLDQLVRNAGWAPEYELRLTREDAVVSVDRKAMIYQSTGEIWGDVALTLSTADPFAALAPEMPRPNQAVMDQHLNKRAIGSASYAPKVERSMAEADMAAGSLAAPEPVVIAAGVRIDGLSVTYEYPRDVTIATGQDGAVLSLDSFELQAELTNLASPRWDNTAFLMANITNDRGEPILPGNASIYRDGAFIGRSGMPLIPAGGAEDVSFGALEGLRLKYRLLDNDTGDVGLVSRSNTRAQMMEFSVENLTDEAQDVRSLFALPYSEQEDLIVKTRARPAPSAENYEKDRGVGAWDMTLQPGEQQTVTVDVNISWPSGSGLYWQP